MNGIASCSQTEINPTIALSSSAPKMVSQAVVFGVIQDPKPKLRYQTSEHARQYVTPKLLDLTGDIYLEELRKFNDAKSEAKH